MFVVLVESALEIGNAFVFPVELGLEICDTLVFALYRLLEVADPLFEGFEAIGEGLEAVRSVW